MLPLCRRRLNCARLPIIPRPLDQRSSRAHQSPRGLRRKPLQGPDQPLGRITTRGPFSFWVRHFRLRRFWRGHNALHSRLRDTSLFGRSCDCSGKAAGSLDPMSASAQHPGADSSPHTLILQKANSPPAETDSGGFFYARFWLRCYPGVTRSNALHRLTLDNTKRNSTLAHIQHLIWYQGAVRKGYYPTELGARLGC
jgi:hypothetical protein